MVNADELPDYLVETVARERFAKEATGGARWEDLDASARAGFLEVARMILLARSAQSDIKR